MSTSSADDGKHVVELITKNQGRLYAYILSLLYRDQDSQDVLQETNMVLWGKRLQAPAADEFMNWASKVAYYQVLAYRKRKMRDRLFFSEKLLSELAVTAGRSVIKKDERSQALLDCLERLPKESRLLLHSRYASTQSLLEIAKELKKTKASITQALYRIRNQVFDCVLRKESEGGP